ncbi:hypothetical protein D3C81_1954930 [compost metagenome]
MASSSILLTKRTTGASSASPPIASSFLSVSPLSISRPSRSTSARSSSPPVMLSNSFSMASPSLSSSTRMASVVRPVLNCTSVMA